MHLCTETTNRLVHDRLTRLHAEAADRRRLADARQAGPTPVVEHFATRPVKRVPST